MMINAYVLYLLVNEEYGVDEKMLLSLHHFQKLIALSWIIRDNTVYEAKKESEDNTTVSKKRPRSLNSSISSVSNFFDTTLCPEAVPLRVSQVSNISLATTGRLGVRLDANYNHLPQEFRLRAECALHRWAMGVDREKKIYGAQHAMLMCN